MPFTDQEYFEVIEKNEIVKKAFENIKQICIDLQKQTNCPEEDLKDFLEPTEKLILTYESRDCYFLYLTIIVEF